VIVGTRTKPSAGSLMTSVSSETFVDAMRRECFKSGRELPVGPKRFLVWTHGSDASFLPTHRCTPWARP
jgi:hypothetical protein